MRWRPSHSCYLQQCDKVNAIVIGCSAGGLGALRVLLKDLPIGLKPAIIICAHIAPEGPSLLPTLLASQCHLPVSEAMEREPIMPGHIYTAPPNYHLLIEDDLRFSLSVDARVCYVRPAIDVLFTSAAEAYGKNLLGILLTGANNDGTMGLKAIKAAGGKTVVQDPATAEADIMPRAAILAGAADQILTLHGITNEIFALYPFFSPCTPQLVGML